MNSFFKKDDIRFGFSLIVIGLFVRIWGITYGLPSTYNSTEYFIAKHALSFGARQSLEPLYYIYPTFYPYLIAFLYAIYFGVGKVFGYFPTSSDFAFHYFADPTSFYLLGRLTNAIVIILTVLLFYRTSRYYLEPRLAFLISLVLLSSNNIHFFTFWMVPDSFLLLGTVIVLYYMVKIQFKNISRLEYIISSLVCGLTVSTKYNAGFLVLGWILAIFWWYKTDSPNRIKYLFISVGLVLIGFLLGSPYWLIKFSNFLGGFRMILSQSQYSFNFETGLPYIWEIIKLIRTEWLLGVLMILLMSSLFLKFNREFLPFAAIIIPTFLFVGSWEKKGLDYLLIIFPTILIILLLWISKNNQKFKMYRWFPIFLIFVLALNVPRVLLNDYQKTMKDSRQMTGEWIMNNYEQGTAICYDHYHYDINLIDINRYLSYGEGSRYLDVNVRKKLKQLRNVANNYHFVSAQKHLEIADLSNKLLMSVQADTFLRQTFLHPHKSLQELRDEGVKLLILNSDTYLKYLDNPAPPKTNPLQIDFIQRKSFYHKVLSEMNPIKKIQPKFPHLGPDIQIFELRK